jgi:hypothetical protein
MVGAHLSEPGAFAFDLAEFPYQQEGEHFAIGKFLVGGTSSASGSVGGSIVLVHPVIYQAIDDQEEVFSVESVR